MSNQSQLSDYAALPLSTAGGGGGGGAKTMEEGQQKEQSDLRYVNERLHRLVNFASETRHGIGVLTLTLMVLMAAALIWLIPISVVLGNTVDGLHAMNHTLRHDHKVVEHLQPDVRAIQDYLVANVFDPCPNAQCQAERLIQMFGGELPGRYQHYLVGVWAQNHFDQQEYDQRDSQVAG